MVTISCSCGSASTTRANPLRGLSLPDRVDLVRAAYSVHAGFLSLEVDASWHPSQDDAAESCVVLVDLDALDATEGLDPADARTLRNLLEVAHVRGRLLPQAVEHGSVRFRVAPADDFDGTVTYLVLDGATTVLEQSGPLERDLLDQLVGLYQSFGVAALVQVDGLAPRLGLRSAMDGVLRARTPSVA
ncbi:hypothetical protein [Cellulomonas edaphi]|uniref:Uncharacterized protein n=1 Tax=Cellulomonas edaphi TaxID=3053468 RepID=A0ABT7S3J3_9CELL|nr:hypothetical protein [Cellulomons edaphi]MDM7830191.1 hypothetical protein [Cellulomons edaphi]